RFSSRPGDERGGQDSTGPARPAWQGVRAPAPSTSMRRVMDSAPRTAVASGHDRRACGRTQKGARHIRNLTLALSLLALPSCAHAEDVWRWQAAHGTVHYTNVPGTAPENAEQVKTRITIEADALPGGSAPQLAMADGDVAEAAPAPAPARRPKAAAKAPP